eukprot:1235288-Prymnesium_polylepis.1
MCTAGAAPSPPIPKPQVLPSKVSEHVVEGQRARAGASGMPSKMPPLTANLCDGSHISVYGEAACCTFKVRTKDAQAWSKMKKVKAGADAEWLAGALRECGVHAQPTLEVLHRLGMSKDQNDSSLPSEEPREACAATASEFTLPSTQVEEPDEEEAQPERLGSP